MEKESAKYRNKMPEESLDQFFARKPNQKEFHALLYHLLDEKGLDNVTVYKRAGIDRKTWSKLISNGEQRPTKRNVCAIAIALELDFRDCKNLVKSAGYILNRDPFDLVIRYCVEQGIYDPLKVDALLIEKGQKPLFSA